MRKLRVWALAAATLIPVPPAAYANPIVGFLAHLHAADEVPAVLSHGGGAFHGQLALGVNQFTYRLHYFGLKGNVTEIDLHLAQPGASPPRPPGRLSLCRPGPDGLDGLAAPLRHPPTIP